MSIDAKLSLRTIRWPALPIVETVAALISAALLAVIYSPTVHSLTERWDGDPSWSHGYVVLAVFPIMMWLVWKKSGPPWRTTISTGDWVIGLLTVVCGLFLHIGSHLGSDVESLDGAGFVVLLLGAVWVVGGRGAARVFGATVLFLLFMVPWPFSWQQPLAESLQHLVSVTSNAALSALGVPVHRVGYILMLPGQTLEVAEGCSGLRQIIVFVALSAFIGLMNGQFSRCWALLALSLPVAVVANTLRITATAFILVTAGPEWTTGLLHDLEGLVTFAIGLGLLLGAAHLLNRVSRYRRLLRGSPVMTAGIASVSSPSIEPARSASDSSGLTLRFRLVGLVLVLCPAVGLDWWFQQAIAAPGRIATIQLKKSFDAFPTELGDWQGADTQVQNAAMLYGDEHLHRVYRNRVTGQTLTLWMIYTEDGRDRAHHPEVCMRAIGCVEQQDQRTALPVAGHDQPVQRFFFRNPNGRAGQWVYHWYYVFREAAQQQSSTTWQRLIEKAGRKRSGMTVEVFAPQLNGSDVARVDDFARQLDSALQTHLPERAVRGSSRGAYLMIGDIRVVEQ